MLTNEIRKHVLFEWRENPLNPNEFAKYFVRNVAPYFNYDVSKTQIADVIENSIEYALFAETSKRWPREIPERFMHYEMKRGSFRNSVMLRCMRYHDADHNPTSLE